MLRVVLTSHDGKELRPRLRAAATLVVCAFLVLLARLFQVQVVEVEQYARRARQFVDVEDVEAPRGRIFDRNGQALATNRPAHALYLTAWTRFVPGPDGTAQATADGVRVPMPADVREKMVSLLEFVDANDRAKFMDTIDELVQKEDAGKRAKLVRRNLTQGEFARVAVRMEELAPWVELRSRSRRVYPFGPTVGFVTGHMGQVGPKMLADSPHLAYRMGDRVGRVGLERQWENYLRGRLGTRPRVVDARRREATDPPPWTLAALPPAQAPIAGQDMYLTLDIDLQRVAYAALEKKPAGGVVALDPSSGRILAMASVPAIDPNVYEQPIHKEQWDTWLNSPLKPFMDKTVQEHFFPGSTYKVVSAIAALSDPGFDPDEEIECFGSLRYGERLFRDTHRHGSVNLERALIESCNTYFYELAVRGVLSLERVEPVAHALGLGEPTGLGINGEVSGTIPTEAFETSEGTYQGGVRLNSAIGQGNVKATVLQMAVVYAAIANGGKVVTPFLVERIETEDGRVVLQGEPQFRSEAPVMDAADRARILRGLIGVVNDEHGTAVSQRLKSVVVAGKTGTAEVGRESTADSKSGVDGWDTSRDHAWFAGFAPADAPKIVVVAMVPHGGTGADAAAPIVMEVIRAYLGVERDAVDGPQSAQAPPLPGANRSSRGRARAP